MHNLKKAGANWVDGERFFDREAEVEELIERVSEGQHILITAQRRIGKTSLVREALRRLNEQGDFHDVFVDVEDEADAAGAIAKIGARCRSLRNTGGWITSALERFGPSEIEFNELKIKLRADIDAGNWKSKGNDLFAALAEHDPPVVLALDELPILLNRLLTDGAGEMNPKGRELADEFLSWLRSNGQRYQGKLRMIVSGSVSLEPILARAGLSAHANIFVPFRLRAWNEKTASDCLAALAQGCGIEIPLAVRQAMCQRLRHCVPHHVQQFFDYLHEDLRRRGCQRATPKDMERVYTTEMLGIQGQVDLQHYVGRLETILPRALNKIALDMLTEAAVNDGRLPAEAMELFREFYRADLEAEPLALQHVLNLLEHDGYLMQAHDGYRFASGLLEDYWRTRYGRQFRRIAVRASAGPIGFRLGGSQPKKAPCESNTSE